MSEHGRGTLLDGILMHYCTMMTVLAYGRLCKGADCCAVDEQRQRDLMVIRWFSGAFEKSLGKYVRKASFF